MLDTEVFNRNPFLMLTPNPTPATPPTSVLIIFAFGNISLQPVDIPSQAKHNQTLSDTNLMIRPSLNSDQLHAHKLFTSNIGESQLINIKGQIEVCKHSGWKYAHQRQFEQPCIAFALFFFSAQKFIPYSTSSTEKHLIAGVIKKKQQGNFFLHSIPSRITSRFAVNLIP